MLTTHHNHQKSTAEVTFINPNAMARVQLMSEREVAIRISTTDIAPRYPDDKFRETEQMIIDKALAILASKLVDQDPAFLLTSTTKTRQFLQMKLGHSDREIFAVLFLNNQNRVITYEEMSIGTLDAASVYPREIIKRAIQLNAASLILSHNHPSATLQASQADDMITTRICQCANMFNIHVLDHLIVTCNGIMSYAEQGKMPIY